MTDLSACLSGPFRLSDAQGGDLTPRAAKGKGLLLLLLRSPHGLRSRRWLQDKLWSDRSPAQGSCSLRQTLAQVRRSLGHRADVLSADRQNVWLDLDRIAIDRTGRGEFAEGLDVRDPEFEYWLAVERSRGPDAPPGAIPGATPVGDDPAAPPPVVALAGLLPPRRLLFSSQPASAHPGAWLETVVTDNVVRLLCDTCSLEAVDQPERSGDARDLRLSIETFAPRAGAIGLRAALRAEAGGAWRWADHRIIDTEEPDPCAHPAAAQLVTEVVEAVRRAILNDDAGQGRAACADAFCSAGVERLMTMRRADALVADTLFARAAEVRPRGLYDAWRAQVCTIRRIERFDADLAALREAGEGFARRAIEKEPCNSMVLALAANTQLFLLGRPAASFAMAERAVALNPANAMAWWALSAARLYTGDAESAYRDALRGRHLAMRSPARFWWDLQQFAAAMVLGRRDEAIALLEHCVAQCGEFRPPLRYLIALRAMAGDEAGAHGALRLLKAAEADFEVRRMLEDRDYPASLLRRAPIIDLPRIAATLA